MGVGVKVVCGSTVAGLSASLLGACSRVCGTYYPIEDAAEPDAAKTDAAVRDATVDAPIPEDAEAASSEEVLSPSQPSTVASCPTKFMVTAVVSLEDAGLENGQGNAAAPGAIAFGADGAFWFTVLGVLPEREVGRVVLSSEGGATLGFVPPDPASPTAGPLDPVAIAVGPDRAMWATLVRDFALATDPDAGIPFTTHLAEAPGPRTGLSVDGEGRLWWIEPSAPDGGPAFHLAWTTPNASESAFAPPVPDALAAQTLIALASTRNGVTWFTGSLNGGAIFGHARVDASEEVAPAPAGPGVTGALTAGAIATTADIAWFLMLGFPDVVLAGSPSFDAWIVRATELDAAEPIALPADAGAPVALAALSPTCGVLVTHASAGSLTLVSPEGSITQLTEVGTGLAAAAAGGIAVGDSTVAVVTTNPRAITLLTLLP
jgi:hypothetical protein